MLCSINMLVFGELIGFGVLLVVMFSIAVVMSAGRAYTCDHTTGNALFDK